MDVSSPKLARLLGLPTEERFEVLKRRIQPRAESRRFVVVSGFAPLWHPHAGFGLGLVQFMTEWEYPGCDSVPTYTSECRVLINPTPFVDARASPVVPEILRRESGVVGVGLLWSLLPKR